MNLRQRLGGLAARLETGLGNLGLFGFRRPLLMLGILAVLSAPLFLGLRRLSIDADMIGLLPETFPSVRDIEVLEKRFGGFGLLVLVAQNAEPEALERFASDIAPKAEALETLSWCDYRRPTQFFLDRALLFLSVDELTTIVERVEARRSFEQRTRNPLYLDLDEEEPPPLDFDDLKGKHGRATGTGWIMAQLEEEYYIDRDRQLLAVLCKPASVSLDLNYSRRTVDEVQAMLATVDLRAYGPTMRVDLVGMVQKKVDQQDLILGDLQKVTLFAFALITLFYVLHFRRLAAVALIMVPVSVGMTWTYGITGWLFDALNLLTAAFGAILLGLGDHGIHLLGRFEAEVSEGRSGEEAIRLTFGNTGRAIIVAATTMTVAFAGIGTSEFRAFHELGIMAAVGMVMVVVAYLTLLPPMLGLATRLGWRPRQVQAKAARGYGQWLVRHAGRLFAVATLLVLAAWWFIPSNRFDYDTRAMVSMDIPSFRLDKEVDRIIGYSQQPLIILTRSAREEAEVAAALRQHQVRLGDASTIDFIASSADMVPKDQEAKLPLIRRLGAALEGVKASWLPVEVRGLFESVQRMVKVEPFGTDDLPTEIVRQFKGADRHSDGGFMMVFPTIDLMNGEEVLRFAHEVRGVALPNGEHVSVTGEPMIMADVLSMVAREGPPVLLMTLALVFVALLFLMGSVRQALYGLAVPLLTLSVTIGLLPLAGLHLNFVNILLIPLFFGMAIDGAAHLVTREAGGLDLGSTLAETGRSVAGTILTNAMGFGALMIAMHQGVRSMGQVALVGFAVNLLVCLVGLPALIAVWNRRSPVAVAEEKPSDAPDAG